MAHRPVNPSDMNSYVEEFAVSHAVLAGNTLYLSGQAPLGPDFEVVGETFEEQTRIVFDRLTAVLSEAGFTWNDVVKLTSYINTEDRDALWEYCAILKEYLTKYSYTTSVAHTYMLCSMHHPDAMIEVEGIAVKV